MPGFKQPCRFCGQLVDANSASCPFCARPHPHQMVCPYCVAPIQAGWQVCNKCGQRVVVPCAQCNAPIGPDGDVCAQCGKVARYRCPACAAVVTAGEKNCNRCGTKLKDFWKSKGVR